MKLLVGSIVGLFGSRAARKAEVACLREQLLVLKRSAPGYMERLIGSIRRECLDHVVVLGERHLRERLANSTYYNEVRTHVVLDKDAPRHRPVQTVGRIASVS